MIGRVEETSASSKPGPRLDSTRLRGARDETRVPTATPSQRPSAIFAALHMSPKPTRESPRLCRGGSKILTYPEVGSLGPSTGLQTVSRQAHERSPANG